MNKLSQLIGAENRALMQPLRPWHENAQVLLAHGQWEAMFILWMEQHSYRRALQIAHACLSDAPNDVVWQDCRADIALWLAEPDDELRWRIFQHGNSLGFASALGAMALSLFWSEGSMAPAGLDAVYPEADLSPTMLLCSLKSSSLALAGEQLPLVGARTLMDKLLSAEGGEMSLPAARLGDMHVCPMVTPGVPPIPHVGGPISTPGSATVLIGGMPAATLGSMAVCVGPPDSVVGGSSKVLIGGKPAARMGDNCAHGGTIVLGCPTVLIA